MTGTAVFWSRQRGMVRTKRRCGQMELTCHSIFLWNQAKGPKLVRLIMPNSGSDGCANQMRQTHLATANRAAEALAETGLFIRSSQESPAPGCRVPAVLHSPAFSHQRTLDALQYF